MDIIDYLPQKMRTEAEAYMPCGLEEIRVRAGKPPHRQRRFKMARCVAGRTSCEQ